MVHIVCVEAHLDTEMYEHNFLFIIIFDFKIYLDTNTAIHSNEEDTIEMSDDVSLSDVNTGIIFQKEKSKHVTDYQGNYEVGTRNYVCV